jgi:hypothetical protein
VISCSFNTPNVAGVLWAVVLTSAACYVPTQRVLDERTYGSQDNTVVDECRRIANGSFRRRLLLSQLRDFYESGKNRSSSLQRLTIGIGQGSPLSFVWTDFCVAGSDPRINQEFAELQGAQVLVFQGKATAWIREAGKVETISLSEGSGVAGAFEVDGDQYLLSSFRVYNAPSQGDTATFWVVGGRPPTEAEARRVLARLVELTGIRHATVVLQPDFFFGTSGGPALDVLRSPTSQWAEANRILPRIICSSAKGEVWCQPARTECPPPGTRYRER